MLPTLYSWGRLGKKFNDPILLRPTPANGRFVPIKPQTLLFLPEYNTFYGDIDTLILFAVYYEGSQNVRSLVLKFNCGWRLRPKVKCAGWISSVVS